MSKRRGKVTKKIFRLFFLSLLLGVLISGLLCFYKGIKSSIFDGKNQLNIIFILHDFFLCSYQPEDQSLTILQLPENLYLKAPFSLGEYKISTIWDLNRLLSSEKKLAGGGKLLIKTIQDNLYFTSNGWFKYKTDFNINPNLKLNNQTVKNILRKKTGFIELLSNIPPFGMRRNWETNLNTYDLARLLVSLGKVREDKIFVYQADDLKILKKKKLNDNSFIYLINEKSLLVYFKNIFNNQTIKNEELTISVINASKKDGLATKTANIITILGGTVTQVRSENKAYKESLCEVRDKVIADSYTVKMMINIFHCQLKFTDKDERSDINLIVNSDY